MKVYRHHYQKDFLLIIFCFIVGHAFLSPARSAAQESAEIFTLRQTIDHAIKASIGLKAAGEGTKAALAAKKVRRANFFPTLGATYQYKRNDEELRHETLGVISPRNEYTVDATFTQPIFTGFSILNQYKVASFGLDVAEINEKLFRQDVIFEAKKVFFSLLKAQKLLTIAQETVTQIAAQKEVARKFYQAGMTNLSDLLQAQVELANAKQDLVVAENDLKIAKSNFNILLRRPINAPVELKDILTYSFFEHDIDYCLNRAEKNRLELKIADLEIEIAERELKLARKDYFPSISLRGTYSQCGTDWDAKGGLGIMSDASSWDIVAVASWNFWEWGRSYYGSKEKLSRFWQAQYRRTELRDNISFEVKEAYLRTKESEKNIITVKQAIKQAKENFRINQESYKQQLATSTDVLDAQTLLSRTMTNYYTALYNFKILKASLYRVMGQDVLE